MTKEEGLRSTELILQEANAYGLRQEVQEWANRFRSKFGLTELEATEMAYKYWIK